jgi:hypothetical protein
MLGHLHGVRDKEKEPFRMLSVPLSNDAGARGCSLLTSGSFTQGRHSTIPSLEVVVVTTQIFVFDLVFFPAIPLLTNLLTAILVLILIFILVIGVLFMTAFFTQPSPKVAVRASAIADMGVLHRYPGEARNLPEEGCDDQSLPQLRRQFWQSPKLLNSDVKMTAGILQPEPIFGCEFGGSHNGT